MTPKPAWLLQANLRDGLFLDQLKIVLADAGTPWHQVVLVPFVNELPELPAKCFDGPIVCYGPSFVPRVTNHRHLRPGIFFDDANFRWSAMRDRWANAMLAPEAAVLTLRQALESLEATGSVAFVRPDADNKLFDGGVYDLAALYSVAKNIPDELLVVKAEPQTIDAEWRCFVIDGEVVDGSEYRRNGKPSFSPGVPQRAVELVEVAAMQWLPAPVVCIDVARTGDRFGIVEANCFNASRFYAADIPNIVGRVTKFCAHRC
jgi:ATP-grasp domain, R2K clade family 3